MTTYDDDDLVDCDDSLMTGDGDGPEDGLDLSGDFLAHRLETRIFVDKYGRVDQTAYNFESLNPCYLQKTCS